MRHNIGWALQYHPRVKVIWDRGTAEAQRLVEQGELGADDVIERMREQAAAETRKLTFRAWEKRHFSDTLKKKADLEVDEGQARGYRTEKPALKILSELGMLNKTSKD